MRLNATKYFVCLYCKSGLKLTVVQKNKTHIISGTLTCSTCKRKYPIIKGIPRLLPDQLLKEQTIAQYPAECKNLGISRSGKLDAEFFKKQKKTGESFEYEWKRFSKLYKEYESQFLDWVKPLKEKDFKNKTVLDAGCGTGRHAFASAKFGAEVVAFDIGNSVDVAYENTKDLNVHVVQADIFNPPFKAGSFDLIYSIGVLHHLPEPKQGYLSLTKLLKKNNRISIWVYGKEGNALLKILDPIRKILFSKLPLSLNLFLASVFTIPVRWLIWIYKRLKSFKSIHKFLPQYDFLIYLGGLNKSIQKSIIFDQMLAPIAYYLKESEVKDWYKTAKLRNVLITRRNNNSWRGTGVR